jgi:hypothetical protein
MSCFLVSQKHIDTLISCAAFRYGLSYRHKRKRHDVSDPQSVGEMLYNQNVCSTIMRYGDRSLVWYKYKRFRPVFFMPPVAVLKALHCYQYQACETSDWEETQAYAFCRALERALVQELPGYALELPGYVETPWVIT